MQHKLYTLNSSLDLTELFHHTKPIAVAHIGKPQVEPPALFAIKWTCSSHLSSDSKYACGEQLALSLSHSLTHSLTHSLPRSLSLALSHTHSLSLSLSLHTLYSDRSLPKWTGYLGNTVIWCCPLLQELETSILCRMCAVRAP